jgi:1,4-dihydroxy-2-naphthoate polyprenyltransferase
LAPTSVSSASRPSPSGRLAPRGIVLARLALWWRALRVPLFSASVMPVLVGSAAAYYASGRFSWPFFGLAMSAMLALHASANTINDYFGYLCGGDGNNTSRTKLNGGSGVIVEGLVPAGAMLRVAIAGYVLGVAGGLYLVLLLGRQGWPVLLFGVLGVVMNFTYTAPRVALANRGLGELSLGLALGLLPVLGATYVQTRGLFPLAWVAAIAPSLLIMTLLWANEFPDLEADRAVGKWTLVVRLGPSRARYGYYALLAFTYAAVLIPVFIGALPAWTLLGLATLPWAWRSARALHSRYASSERATFLPVQQNAFLVHLLTGSLMALGLIIARLQG